MAVYKRLIPLSTKFQAFASTTTALNTPYSVRFFPLLPSLSSHSQHLINRSYCRQYSQNVNPSGNHHPTVNTLAMVRTLEAQGIPLNQAEAIIKVLNGSLENVTNSFVSKADLEKVSLEAKGRLSHVEDIAEVINSSLENASNSPVSKADDQKIEMAQEASLLKLIHEIQNSQDHHFYSLQREYEKLRTDIDNLQCETKKQTTIVKRIEDTIIAVVIGASVGVVWGLVSRMVA